MGDHFVLLVDRLLTESTLEAAIESRNRMQSTPLVIGEMKIDKSLNMMDVGNLSCSRKLVECRICQDEDEDSNMETPCCCCGSMKYAHRRCVQRWCNEKGDTVCEICHQQFKPGYTAPPPLFKFGRIPMNFRGNWEIARNDGTGPRIITMVSTDRAFLDPRYNDFSASATRSFMWCRSAAVIFMILLILRHTLPFITSGTNDYSFPLFLLLLLRTAGIVLPIFVLLRAVTAILRRRQHQQEQPNTSSPSSDEESENLNLPPSQTHIVRVH